MSTADVGSTDIAVAMIGTMTLGTFCFLLMQVIKGFAGDHIHGARAELVVIGVSAIAVALALVSADSDWYTADTWVALLVGTLSATVIARGLFAQLFKVSVAGSPPDADTEVPAAAVTAAETPPPRIYSAAEGLR